MERQPDPNPPSPRPEHAEATGKIKEKDSILTGNLTELELQSTAAVPNTGTGCNTERPDRPRSGCWDSGARRILV